MARWSPDIEARHGTRLKSGSAGSRSRQPRIGVSARQAATLYGVGISMAVLWVRRATFGKVAAQRQRQPKDSKLDANAAFVLELIDASSAPFSRWIEGFEPTGGDMVFERERPSCFASSHFAEVMAASNRIVIAGFAGEGACLSTMIDGFHRGKRITYLADASASHALEDIEGVEVHKIIKKLAGIYGEIQTTAEWVLSSGQLLLNSGWFHG